MSHVARLRSTMLLAALLTAGPVGAKPWWARGTGSNEADFLPPDVAFRPSVRIDGNVLRLRWLIADGYYLYRRKFEVRAESPDLVVSAARFAPGVSKTDPYLGTQEVFYHLAEGTAAFSRFDAGAHPLQIKVTYQGCADGGLCYLPITKVIFPISLPAVGGVRTHPWTAGAIGAGIAVFFLAGLNLRKGRRLAMPVS